MQARAATSASTALTSNPTTPIYSNDLQWITAYLTIHSLSDPSRVYSYILWIAVAAVFLFFSIVHGLRLRAGYIGALWSKWALRRRTWRKKQSLAAAVKEGRPYTPPVALPSNAQIFTLFVIVLGSLSLSYIGPDYFAPGSQLWNVGQTSAAPIGKRESDAFIQFQPQYTIAKSWWTSAARTGQIAFALLPLCVLLALKAPPFAIFSISFLTHVYFDKLAWLHRWCGILVWFIATLHVVSWSVQLANDSRLGTGRTAYVYAWSYDKFVFGWIAYALLTLMVLGSLPPIRRHHYESFYLLHVLFIPLVLVMSAIHHPPLWWWCWAAIGLWIGERIYRLIWFLHNNGCFGASEISTGPKSAKLMKKASQKSVKNLKPQAFPMHTLNVQTPIEGPQSSQMFQYPTASSVHEVAVHAKGYMSPPGFVHAELLAGCTIRLRIVTPGFLSWAPGQHFLINIPAIGRFTTHPFTAASVCDESARGDHGRELVFLIRAKKGWTRDLRDTVANLIAHGRKHPPGERIPEHAKLPEHGVVMHALVEGPFGSAARADWGSYSSVLIVTGGSGVSFGLSILEFICLCLAGRDGRQLGGRAGGWGRPGFKTSRVRFVWLVREFGHIEWCASALRRCMALVPASELQVDIFVTNAKPVVLAQAPRANTPDDELVPPLPQFAKDDPHPQSRGRTSISQSIRHSRTSSIVSTDSEESIDSDVDLSYYVGDFVGEEHAELGHEEHVLDYTNFEGDDDSILPGEDLLNLSVRKEGRRRRSYIRRASMAVFARQELEKRSSTLSVYEAPIASASSVRLVAPPKPTTLEPITEHMRHAHASHLQEPNSPLTPSDMTTPTSAVGLLANERHFISPPSPLHHSVTSPPYPPSPETTQQHPSLPLPSSRPVSMISQLSQLSQMTGWSNHSLAALVSEVENVRLELSENEMADISVVAERARPGKPKLDRILADEVERSKGAVVVGCCGPTSLNAMMRKHIAAQIDPAKIRRGDMRGSIALVAEDFEY